MTVLSIDCGAKVHENCKNPMCECHCHDDEQPTADQLNGE